MERSELGHPISSRVQKASNTLQIAGNVGFWLQLVLGVFAAALLLLSSAGLAGQGKSTTGTGLSLFCAAAGVVALAISVVLCFRYKRIAQLMRVLDGEQRPKKKNTLQLVKFGLLTNLAGISLAVLGAEAFVGIIWRKLSNVPQGASVYDTRELVTPNEILLVLANTHTILCHVVGLAITLWLLDRLNNE